MLAWTRKSLAVVLSIALVAPAATLYAPTVAHAQQKPKPKPLREQLNEDARKHFDLGLDLGKRGKWDAALTSFLAAYETSKNPRVLFNVAISQKELSQYAAAIATFKRELDEGRGQLTSEEEADIRSLISGLQQYVTSVTIDVNEPGAEIYVDRDRVGVSPLKGPISVPVGTHTIRAVKPGFAEASENVPFKPGEATTVSLKLLTQERTSLVVIAIDGPKSATIKVDNREVGQATDGQPYKGQIKVSAEAHEFSAEANGYVPARQSAVVKEGEPLALTLRMSPEQEKGKLLVVAQPEGSTIEIDGKTVGATRWEGPVDAKTHQIVVKKQGFYTWSYDVEVPRGGERSVTASLNADRNTSFVPWLIGTVLVVGAGTVAAVFLFSPKNEDPAQGTLAPFTVGTTGYGGGGLRF